MQVHRLTGVWIDFQVPDVHVHRQTFRCTDMQVHNDASPKWCNTIRMAATVLVNHCACAAADHDEHMTMSTQHLV